MGIEETKKLINYIKSDIIGLLQIDYGKIEAELTDLDIEEKKELLILVGGAVIEILACIKLSPAGAIVSKIAQKIR